MKIKIIYDSTIGMNLEEVNENNIGLTPFIITDNGKSYRDNIDITPDEFYVKLASSAHRMTTSQPNISDTIELFKETLKEYDHIIYFPLPEVLSGTYSSGILAANEVDPSRITVVDIKTGAGVGNYLVKVGQEMIAAGKSVAEIVAYYEKAKDNSRFFIVPLTLDGLKAGGRISNVAASVFTMVKLRIALYLSDRGSIDKFEIARTDGKILKGIIDKVKKDLGVEDLLIYLYYTDDIKILEGPREVIKKAFPNAEYKIMHLCSTFGAHTGVNTYGFHFVKKYW